MEKRQGTFFVTGDKLPTNWKYEEAISPTRFWQLVLHPRAGYNFLFIKSLLHQGCDDSDGESSLIFISLYAIFKSLGE